MMRGLSLIGLPAGLILSACSEASPPERGLQPTTLEGEWRVAAIDGEPAFKDLEGRETLLFLRAGYETIHWAPDCAHLMFIYQIDGENFRADRIRFDVPYDDPDFHPSNFMPPSCSIGLPPRLDEALVLMAAARKIELMDGGHIRLASGSRSFTLIPLEPKPR